MTLGAAFLKSILVTEVAASGKLEGAKIKLVENTEAIGPETPVADLVDAAYDGYADSAAVTWGTPFVTPAGNAAVHATPVQFKPTGDTASSTVNQVVLMNADGDQIIAAYTLTDPIQFDDADDVAMVGFPLVLGQTNAPLPEVYP